jgi:hypothetical protein
MLSADNMMLSDNMFYVNKMLSADIMMLSYNMFLYFFLS